MRTTTYMHGRECIEDHLSDNSYCPKCNQPSYRKDMKPNSGLVRTLFACLSLATRDPVQLTP